MGEQGVGHVDAALAQVMGGTVEIDGVLQDDGRDDQVETRCSVSLVLEGPVAQLAEPVEKTARASALRASPLLRLALVQRRRSVSSSQSSMKRGIGRKVLASEGASIDTTTVKGRLVFPIFAGLAEFERELIVERTKAGLTAWDDAFGFVNLGHVNAGHIQANRSHGRRLMLNAITSRSNLTDIIAPLRRTTTASFDTALDKATAANVSTSDAASISDKAKSMRTRPAAPQFGKEYFENFANLSLDQLKKQIATDADAVSASQGLPSGQYNFKSLTVGQAEVVFGNLGLNLGVKPDDLLAVRGNLGRMSLDDLTPHDMTDGLAESAAFERGAGNAAGAALLEGSLAAIVKFSAKVVAPDPTQLYQSLTALRSESR